MLRFQGALLAGALALAPSATAAHTADGAGAAAAIDRYERALDDVSDSLHDCDKAGGCPPEEVEFYERMLEDITRKKRAVRRATSRRGTEA